MKKSLVLLILAVFLLTSMVPAFADATLRIGANDEHKYDVYQIYTGTAETENKKLSDIKYGVSHISVDNSTILVGDSVPDADIEALEAINNKSEIEKADAIKKLVNMNAPVVTNLTRGGSESLPTGYYLVVDKGTDGAGAVPDGSSLSLYVTTILNTDVTITPKRDTVTSEKFIKDKDDSVEINFGDNWEQTADHDIGDAIPFKLTAKLPGNYNMYKTYYLQFHDILDDTLSFNKDSVKVYVDGVLLPHNGTNYTVVTENGTDDCTFGVVFANLKTAAPTGFSKVPGNNSIISVEYTATLKENAVIGGDGNHNKSKIEYSNNPNWDGTGTEPHGETPWDDVAAYTFQLVVSKVDGQTEPQPLPGAGFTLEKQQPDGGYKLVKTIVATTLGDNPTEEQIAAATTFSFVGLDAGQYRLTESTTPAGYNTIKPIEFEIIATHGLDANGKTELKTLSGETKAGIATFSATAADGTLKTTIVNNEGTVLPTTGGMGTTALYIGGGLLVLFAIVTLVAKRRTNAEK